MKLALIRRQFSATGGAELYLRRLLAPLVASGHEVHLFAESWAEPSSGVIFHQVKVIGSRAMRPVSFAEAVRMDISRNQFDCVFSLERTLSQDVYRAGDGVHRVWLKRRKEFAPWWRRPFVGIGSFHRNMQWLEARTFDPRNTRFIIVNSDMVKREITEYFKFPEERIRLVRNGVEVARIRSGKRAATRSRFGVEEDEFLMLFVGSGWERKGLGYAIEAAHWLAGRRVKLLVVGKGRKPSQVPGNVVFAGAMTEVEDAYAAADLLLFLPIYEPASNVVFEARAAGLPVVTTRNNGAGEIIQSREEGCVIDDPRDHAAVMAAVDFHLQQGKRRVSSPLDLSLEHNVTETLAVLELAARARRG